jgi:hypothetical protein
VAIQGVALTSQSGVDDLRKAGLAVIEGIHHPDVFERSDGAISVVVYTDQQTGHVDSVAILFPVPVGARQ